MFTLDRGRVDTQLSLDLHADAPGWVYNQHERDCSRCGQAMPLNEKVKPAGRSPSGDMTWQHFHPCEAPKRKPRAAKVEVVVPPVKSTERRHKLLPKLLRKLAAGLHVMLVGPAGSGKTTLASQAAQELGLEFSFISCSAGMSEGQLLGRLLPVEAGGTFNYVPSALVEAYESGKSLFLLDEFDAADGNTATVLNAALAGKTMALPNRAANPLAQRHKDFKLIAAANTFGLGADRMYAGRNQLDGATLNRFTCATIEVDYDRELEADLVPDSVVRDTVWKLRDLVRERKFRQIVGTRDMLAAQACRNVGEAYREIFADLLVAWSADERKAAQQILEKLPC
ncbi:MAG: AAA family ATPase [Pirellulales bacterium]|nr:AAA family ATPase [Pirellulales bacterium]